ncbi:unnamed protein product [Amaranthus hypochondriacus]
MPRRSLVSWNSMIGGFAAKWHAEEALNRFSKMLKEGWHMYFNDMQRIHNLSPRIEHYGCFVDLYSRAGKLEKALYGIKNMPMKPNEIALRSLLAACRNCSDIGLAQMVVNFLVDLDPGCDSNYVMLANIHAAVGSWEGACKVR